jgi:hypothetical protein
MAFLKHEPLKRTCKFNASHEITNFKVEVMFPKLVLSSFTSVNHVRNAQVC